MNKYVLSLFALLLLAGSVFAQTTQVTGTVTDAFGPVPGAAVILRGTTIGVTTNAQGNFTINVPDIENGVLEIKFLGMRDEIVPLQGRISGIEVRLTESANQLDEVVVIGYGTEKRGNVAGAMASVSGEVIARAPVANAAEAMVGKMPGVQVTMADGSPDAEIMIRVRGGGSLTQDNSPLILVDGFEVNSINDVSPNDIQSIDVLKDAAASAIYGARGANGVVLVTTKQPKEGAVSVSFNAYASVNTIAKKMSVMNPYEYVMAQHEYAVWRKDKKDTINKFGDPEDFYIYKGYKGTDWQDEAKTNPTTKVFNATVSGGTKNATYNLSFNWQDRPGILIGNGLRQASFNPKLNIQLHDNLRLELVSRFSNKNVAGRGTSGINMLTLARYAPTEGLLDFMNIPDENEYYENEDDEQEIRQTPFQMAENEKRSNIQRSFTNQARLNWSILPGLTFSTQFGYDYGYQTRKDFHGSESGKSRNDGTGQPQIELYERKETNYQWTNTLSYVTTLDEKHFLNMVVGTEVKDRRSESSTVVARKFPMTMGFKEAFANLSMGEPFTDSSSSAAPNRTLSFFGRVNYTYDNKYIVSLSFRSDGSSKFDSGNQWGFFPGVALGWRIDQEDFMKGVTYVSNLKLRLSYGSTGNNNINSGLWRFDYRPVSGSKSPGWERKSNVYYEPSTGDYLFNPNLKWETTITRNAGLDFGFFRERLNGTLDVYWNTVKDLLVPSDVPRVSGFTKQWQNVGQTSNRGIELALVGHIIQREDWSLDANFNIGRNKGKVDKLASGETMWLLKSDAVGTDILDTYDYRVYVGGQKGLIYGYINDGFYTFDDFEDYKKHDAWVLKEGVVNSKHILELNRDPLPGSAKFKKTTPVDENDPNTYNLSSEDRVVIGNTTPKFSGGFGVNATYKNFDLYVFCNFMYGFDVYNANNMRMASFQRNNWNNFSTDFNLDKRFRWVDDMGNDLRNDPDGLRALNPNPETFNMGSIGRPTTMTYIIEDGSFLRLNTVTLGYTLPERLTRKVGVSRFRVYATGYNLHTFTGYSGFDPETNIEKGQTPNVDNNAYPRSRTYTLGLQLNF